MLSFAEPLPNVRSVNQTVSARAVSAVGGLQRAMPGTGARTNSPHRRASAAHRQELRSWAERANWQQCREHLRRHRGGWRGLHT